MTGADLVVEAVPEEMAIKHETLTAVESHVDPATLIASNTSSLSVTEILSALERPERGLGLHFFNPVHIMGLVEVVVAEQTSESTLAFATEFVEGIDKTAVEVGDSPGFASSRLGVALGVEAMRMVQEGVASPADVDTAMELGYNHPMGPLELGDASASTFASTSSNTYARNWASASARRKFSSERSAPASSARRPVRASTSGRAAKSSAPASDVRGR